MVVDKKGSDVSTDDADMNEDNQSSCADLGSLPDSTDSDMSLDSSLNSPDDTLSGDEMDEVQTYLFQSSDSIVLSIPNATKKAITSFERFIFPEWPAQIKGSDTEALRMLRLQLLNGGGFCVDMKLIDLSTPANVRLDIQDVLNLLKEKFEEMSHCTLNSIEKLVLPNVKELTAGDIVKKILKEFCLVLCGENGEIKELVLRSDEISNEFTAGDLGWIEDFLSSYNLDTVTVSIL